MYPDVTTKLNSRVSPIYARPSQIHWGPLWGHRSHGPWEESTKRKPGQCAALSEECTGALLTGDGDGCWSGHCEDSACNFPSDFSTSALCPPTLSILLVPLSWSTHPRLQPHHHSLFLFPIPATHPSTRGQACTPTPCIQLGLLYRAREQNKAKQQNNQKVTLPTR